MNTRYALVLAAILGTASLARSQAADPAPAARAGAAPSWEQLAAEFAGTPAATRPWRDAEMKFSTSNEVAEIPVKGGQRVKKNDLLARAKDSEIKAATAQQKALAETDLEIKGAQAQLELANIRFDNLKRAGEFSQQEFDERRVEAMVAAVQFDQANFNREQQQLRLNQLIAQYDRYQLIAPFDGIIDEVFVDVGHGVTEQDKIVRIVDIDRLWLDPTPPTSLTIELGLKPGSPAWVLIDLPGKPELIEGRVIEVSPVADSVSLTRRVRVEIDNPKAWPAGTQALVKFTAPTRASASAP